MLKSKKNEIKYFIVFSFLFILMFYLCFGIWFQKYEKTFLRSYDGLDQHYLIFVYIGRWIRTIFKNFFIEHKFSVPMWNMGIGYGADIITSTGAYLPDPFNWISAIVPGRYSEYAYNFIIIIKIYLSGLAFTYFCRYHKISRFSSLIGSFIYMFSGTMYIIFVESFFANPMYIFPFIMVGVDKIWNNNGTKLYVFSLAFMFINYFYFGYMSSILIFGYCVLRMIYERKTLSFNKIKKIFFNFLGFSFLSIGISMGVLLPIILVVLKAGRLGVKYYIPFFYPEWYYSNFISGFFCFFGSSRDAYIGFGLIVFFCIILLFIHKNHKFLKIIFLILTIGICFPYFGKAMNGFSYYANRWCWAYTLCVSYIVSVMLEKIKMIQAKEKTIISICCVFYILIVRSIFNVQSDSSKTVSLLLIIMLLCFCQIQKFKDIQKNIILLILTMLSIFVSSFYTFNEKKGNFIRDFVKRNTAFERITEANGFDVLKIVNLDRSERYNKEGVPLVRNSSWLYGISGMDFYISIYNNYIDTFHNALAMCTSPWTMGYNDLDKKSELQYLMNVKYFVTYKDNSFIPYNFDVLVGDYENNLVLYENKKNNSIVHGFDYVINKKEISDYEPYYKQQLIMNMPYVDAFYDDDFTLEFNKVDDEIYYNETILSDNINMKEKMVDVSGGNGTISINVDILKNTELYVYIDNIDFNNKEQDTYNVGVRALYNDVEISNRTLGLLNNRSHMYGGKHNWLINLGIIKNDVNRVVFDFYSEGHYTLDGIHIYAKPVSEIEENIINVPNIAKNVIICDNKIDYDIVDDSYNYMMISVPYSSGWKAYVDGERREIRICDDAFMLLNLKPGDKHVELKYTTPGLLPGLMISIASIFIYIIVLIKQKKHI